MTDFPAWLTGLMAVLLLTAFVKIFTVLSILRYGIGLGAGVGAVIFALSLALTVFAVSPQIENAGGLDALLGSASGATMQPALEKNFRPFVERNTRPEILEKFLALAARQQASPPPSDPVAAAPAPQKTAFSVLVPAFLVSQLREAFQLGFLILIPFLVIDLLVANALMLLDMKQLPQPVVALPFKVLLFVAIDGWALVSSKVLGAYLQG